MTPGAPTPRFPRRVAAALIATAVALLLAEGLLRVAPINRADEARTALRSSFLTGIGVHPRWGSAFLADLDLRWDYTGRERTEIVIDFATVAIPGQPPWGMRDDGIDDGRTVIPVLGDSFTFGATVQLDEIWCERIEAADDTLDLLDLAQGGGLAKAAAQYRTVRDHLPAHDTVIYAMWLGNEFYDNQVFSEAIDRLDVELRAHERTRTKYRVMARLHLACFVDTLVKRVAPGRAPWETPSRYRPEPDGVWHEELGNFYVAPANPMLTRYLEQPYTDPSIDEGIAATGTALADLVEQVGERELVLLLLPFKEQVHARVTRQHRHDLIFDRPQQEVTDLCARHGITCHDLLPALVAHEGERLFWDFDPHFTPLGQRRAAEAILPLLSEHSVTAPSEPPLDSSPPTDP
jgi:hypothetical protein